MLSQNWYNRTNAWSMSYLYQQRDTVPSTCIFCGVQVSLHPQTKLAGKDLARTTHESSRSLAPCCGAPCSETYATSAGAKCTRMSCLFPKGCPSCIYDPLRYWRRRIKQRKPPLFRLESLQPLELCVLATRMLASK